MKGRGKRESAADGEARHGGAMDAHPEVAGVGDFGDAVHHSVNKTHEKQKEL